LTLLVALMLARSRAGLILAIISSAAVVFVVVLTRGGQKSTGRRSVKLSWLWTTAAVASIGAIVLELGLGRVATRFGQDPLEDLRLPLAETVLSLIGTYLPLGSGVGTFAPVYALAERQDTLLSAYANRAHNDWLEFALEGGLVAGVIIVAFGIWYASRLSDAMGSQTPMPQRLMAIAGALGIAVVALHSSVDYPLRTSAIAALFAMCCALMTPVRISESRSSLMFDDGPRPKARPNAYPVEAEQVAAQPVSDWPDAWKPKN
ncbi:MAG: O-antigen ligase family protein, partial [Pseudomonadota bacterium]